MTAYQGGTVWIQAIPSFDGFQRELRRGVRDAFAGAGIDKDARKAFEGVQREAAAAGEKAGRRYSTSFGKLTGDRIKRMEADFRQLAKSLPEREFAVIEARLDRIRSEERRVGREGSARGARGRWQKRAARRRQGDRGGG